jgi:3-hydroxyisobutyrate dehydrogenase
MKVGYIGLGNMGAPMARNILKAGHELSVYNRTRTRAEELGANGARVAQSPREAADGAEVTCICVSTPDVVREVVLAEDGALAGAVKDAVIIDFSTVDPETSRSVGRACGERNIAFLDAPMSGGVAGAAAGTLTVIVGGDRVAYERAQPIFAAVGKKVVHVGPSGAGSTIKLINQMLVGINLAGAVEAFVVGQLAGIDPQVLYDILSTSAGASAALTRAVPDFFLKRNFEAGFAVKLLLKDLDLALQLGKAVHTPLYVTSVARQLYEEASASGLEEKDITAAIMPRERLHGIEIRGREETP